MKRLLTLILTFCLLCALSVPALCAEETDVPSVRAKAAVLLEQETGTLLFGQNEHEKLYPASVTKVMSLLLFFEALERGDLSLQTTVTADAEAAGKGGSQIWLKEGEQMSVDELLRATAIGSANDACTALAEACAGSEASFVRRMNERAKELGMNDTHFDNCTGLDDDTTTHLTSAYDVALMSRALLSHEKVLDYTTVWMDALRGGQTQLVNTNKLVRHYKDTTGLKTGTTAKAGCCISASAKRDGLHLIAVVLGAETSADRFAFARELLDWGFASFEAVTPEVPPELLAPLPVQRGKEAFVLPKVQALPPLVLRRGEKQKLQITADMAEGTEAPVAKGQSLGTLTFSVGDKAVAECTLCAESDVGRLTLFDVFLRLLASLACRERM